MQVEKKTKESLSCLPCHFFLREDGWMTFQTREVNYVCYCLEGTVGRLIISLADGCPQARANVLGMLMQGNLGSDDGKKDNI